MKNLSTFINEQLNEATAPHPHQKELWGKGPEVMSEKQSYDEFFQSKLEKFGVKSPAELKGDDKKKFFDEIDKEWDAVNENLYEKTYPIFEKNSMYFTAFDTLKCAGIKSNLEDENNFDYMHVPGDNIISPMSKKSKIDIENALNKAEIAFRSDKTSNIILL